MVYDTQKELEKVIGKLKDNAFIRDQQQETIAFRRKASALNKLFGKPLRAKG